MNTCKQSTRTAMEAVRHARIMGDRRLVCRKRTKERIMHCDVCHGPIRDEDVTRGHLIESGVIKCHLWCWAEIAPPTRSAVRAMLPGLRPAGTCCEKCRLTPSAGITDGERFLCRGCAGGRP